MLRSLIAGALLTAVFSSVDAATSSSTTKTVMKASKDTSASSSSSSSTTSEEETSTSEEEVTMTSSSPKNEVQGGVNAFMYNIATDPTESINIYDKPAYTAGQEYFQARMTDYYAPLVTTASIPSSDDMYATWKKNGGLVPWVETNLKSGPIGKKYTYTDAPHIVFMLVDDWGWNDVGYHSTYMSWTTPNINTLAASGIKLENHYSHELCSPSRGALLTGRYALRLGLWDQQDSDPFAELPLTETTLAQELKSAGYETYMVGKWDLGFSTKMHNPTNRGFDQFYGYYSSFVDYWSKEHNGYLDLQSGEDLVTDATETDKTKHNVYLMQEKFEAMVDYHVATYPFKPMFMYYSTQLIHGPWSAPSTYTDRCGVPWKIADPRIQSDTQNYCALNLMLDEIVANVTCKLKVKQMAENTIFVIVSDNGGEKTVAGNSYPFKGHKGAYQRGGVSSTAIVHSALIESSHRGATYTGTMHIADWLPSLMHAATNGAWEGSLSGADLDGVDLWTAITTAKNTVEHEEIPFYVAPDGSASVIQRGNYKYYYNTNDNSVDEPEYVFEYDLVPAHTYQTCASVVMTGEDIHPKEVDPTLAQYRSTVRGENNMDFLDVDTADYPKAGSSSTFAPPVTATTTTTETTSATTSSTSSAAVEEPVEETTAVTHSSGPTAQKSASTSTTGTTSQSSNSKSTTAANQATATAPIAQHSAPGSTTTALYQTNGYSSISMIVSFAALTALLLTIHVCLKTMRSSREKQGNSILGEKENNNNLVEGQNNVGANNTMPIQSGVITSSSSSKGHYSSLATTEV